jgi:mono/diheme cytochrome c family protein
MSFSPKTGLVYIPAQVTGGALGTDAHFAYAPGQWNLATNPALNTLPADPKALAAIKNGSLGYLIAWDPVAKKEVWRAPHVGPWNGGTLATAGGLVFQGTADGHFNAYDAATGKQLWSTETYTATEAGPMTYTVDGEQYVAVGAGSGTLFYILGGYDVPKQGTPANGRIVVYKLGGAAVLPKPDMTPVFYPKPPAVTAPQAIADAGHLKYNAFCLVCHGYNAIGAGVIPDLRKSVLIGDDAGFKDVVLGGSRKSNGMVSFANMLKPEDVEAIRAYLITAANDGYPAPPPAKTASK